MLTRFFSQALRLFPSRPRLLAPLLVVAGLVAVPTQAAQVTYYHPDGLGSAVMESNEAGQVTYSREYRPYGEQVVGAAKDGPGFTGHVADLETGMTYMQQRYYDPASGRFLSVDPVTPDSNTGGNFNRYWYANNNPYKFTDPDGRAPKWMDHPKMFPQGSLIRVAGEAIGADIAYVVGVATGDVALQDAALNGMQEHVTAADGVGAATMLIGPRGSRGPGQGNMAGTARNPNKLAPHKDATGPHTSFRTDAKGKVTNYETYDVNPTTGGFGAEKRFRGDGKAHGGVEPPLILERPGAGQPGGAGAGARPVVPRKPASSEKPRGY